MSERETNSHHIEPRLPTYRSLILIACLAAATAAAAKLLGELAQGDLEVELQLNSESLEASSDLTGLYFYETLM